VRWERGSAAVLLLAVAGLVVLLTVAVADAGIALAARLQASGAADAAALAAAPVTFRPFGATGSPEAEARRLANANGVVLTRCSCSPDRTWRSRVVEVVVERRIQLLGFGTVTVSASSRAEFSPTALIGGDIPASANSSTPAFSHAGSV
jgi:secretion/DNA translocation related TadE-like protein